MRSSQSPVGILRIVKGDEQLTKDNYNGCDHKKAFGQPALR